MRKKVRVKVGKVLGFYAVAHSGRKLGITMTDPMDAITEKINVTVVKIAIEGIKAYLIQRIANSGKILQETV